MRVKSQVVRHRDGPSQVQRIAYDQHAANVLLFDNFLCALQVFERDFGHGLAKRVFRGDTALDGIVPGDNGFGQLTVLADSTGKDDDLDSPFSIQVDSVLDAFFKDGRGLLIPDSGAQHNCSVCCRSVACV